jgi:ANTAR domain
MDPDAVRALAASMPVIEQAKGVLMGCYGCDPTAAFAVLVRLSSTRNVKLRDLASAVVEAVSGEPQSGAGPMPSPCERVRRVLDDPPEQQLRESDGRGGGHADWLASGGCWS